MKDRLSAATSCFSNLPEKPFLLLAVFSVLIIYLASVGTTWAPTPDSALYLMLGNNLVSGEGYTLWGAPHAHVPPGYPVMLGVMHWIGVGRYDLVESDHGRHNSRERVVCFCHPERRDWSPSGTSDRAYPGSESHYASGGDPSSERPALYVDDVGWGCGAIFVDYAVSTTLEAG